MRFLATVARRVSALFRRRRLDDDLREELAAHLEARRRALIDDGMEAGEAARESRRQFGNVTLIAEQARDARGFPLIESFLQDVRYGARLLFRAPLFTLVSVLSLAFGLGAGLAIFTVINAMILRPIAVGGEDIYRIYTGTREGTRLGSSSYADYRDFTQARAFKAWCLIDSVRANVTAGAASATHAGGVISGGCFDLLRLRAHRGRFFSTSDAAEAVISYSLWKRRFGGDPSVIGMHILLSGAPATIVGVAPMGFSGTSLDGGDEFWVPIERFAALLPPRVLPDRRYRSFAIYARLHDGVSQAQAEAELSGVAASLHEQDPAAWTDGTGQIRRVTVMKEMESRFAGSPGAVPAMLAGVIAIIAAVVSIACVNIATLLLARGAARTRELTIRLAIGASRARLLRQLATETLLIAAFGAAIALGAINAAIRIFETHRPEGVPAVSLVIDWHVAVVAATIALLATILCGLLPAAHVVRLAIVEGMKGRAAAVRTRWMRAGTREALIVIQVAASVAMLLVSTLFARGMAAGATISPGFTTDGVATIAVDLGTAGGKTPGAVAQRVVDAVGGVPNVASPSIARIIPLTGSAIGFAVGDDSASTRVVDGNIISPGYLATVGMALRRGRDFDERDRQGGVPVAIVSETLARTLWKTIDVVDRSLVVNAKALRVIGVVADIRYRAINLPYPPLLYLPFAQAPQDRFVIHARVRGGGETLAAMDAAARSIDPRIMLDAAMPLSRRIQDNHAPERMAGWIGGAVGAVQFSLVLMALWALVAYAVERRTHEIGVRLALGATRAGVVKMLLGPALVLIGAGAILGSVMGLIAAVVFQSEFIGLGTLEPAAGLPAVAAMAVVAALAAFVPARRATRVDPIVALRAE